MMWGGDPCGRPGGSRCRTHTTKPRRRRRCEWISVIAHCQISPIMICLTGKPETSKKLSEKLGNEGQQPPLPPQGPQEQQRQQGYYGWQYDQDQPGPVVQQSPVIPPQPVYPGQQQPTVYPPQHYGPGGSGAPVVPGGPGIQGMPPQPQPVPPRYQQPIRDMGTSLGYGQGMEYQYFNAPQPSQALPQLRQARLQQLREERMRRQQRRVRPDYTGLIQRKSKKPAPPGATALPSSVPPPQAMPQPPVWNQNGPQAPVEMSPLMSMPPTEFSPRRSNIIPPSARSSASGFTVKWSS